MSNNKLTRVDRGGSPLNTELPSVPEAFRRTDYEGWLPEVIKRVQLRAYERTQAERIVVLRQINDIQSECLAIARNEANWRHLDQEDRIRQKKLELQEMELDQQIEDRRYEGGRKTRDRNNPATPTVPTPRNPVEEINAQLDQAIRTEAGVKEAFAAARQKHPHLDELLREWESKLLWDLRERKWF